MKPPEKEQRPGNCQVKLLTPRDVDAYTASDYACNECASVQVAAIQQLKTLRRSEKC
jgi:hypothetical protein